MKTLFEFIQALIKPRTEAPVKKILEDLQKRLGKSWSERVNVPLSDESVLWLSKQIATQFAYLATAASQKNECASDADMALIRQFVKKIYQKARKENIPILSEEEEDILDEIETYQFGNVFPMEEGLKSLGIDTSGKKLT